MSEEAICICEKHDFYDFFPNNEKTKCPCCEVELLTAELDQVKYDRSVKHEMAAEQIDELTKELARYKSGVEVTGDYIDDPDNGHMWWLDLDDKLPFDNGQHVRVLVMPMEDKNE